MMTDLSALVRQFNSCKPEMKKLFRLSDISSNMPIALATDYLSQSIQLSLSMRGMLQAIADHPTEATPEQISGMKTLDGYLSKKHEDCKVKLVQRYNDGYDTVCNKLKNIDWGPWNALAHLKILDEMEDCLGDLAITLEAIKECCSDQDSSPSSDYLTDEDKTSITSNLTGLITRRRTTYNLVKESLAFWSKQGARDQWGNSYYSAEITEEVSVVAKISSVETHRTENEWGICCLEHGIQPAAVDDSSMFVSGTVK